MTRTLSLVVIACAMAVSSPAIAQQPTASEHAFDDLQGRLKPGTVVFVIDRQGRETSGTMTRLSASSLVVMSNGIEREIRSTDIGRIEKLDGEWNGPIVGAVIGGIVGLSGLAGIPCRPHCAGEMATASILGAGIGAGIGLAGDRGVKGRKLLFNATSSPTVRLSAPVAGVAGVAGVAQPDASPLTLDTILSSSHSTSFADLWVNVKSGDTVDVIDASGTKTRGKFQKLSESSMLLLVDGQLREISASAVHTVIRPRDSIWNGAAIGSGLGLLLGALQCESGPGDCAAGLTGGAVYLGLIGAGIDLSIGGGKKVVYVSPSSARATTPSRLNVGVSSVFTKGRKAVNLAFRF